MKTTTEHRRRTSTIRATALACLAGLAVAPGAFAEPTGISQADTVIGALGGGVQTPHKYLCDENNPIVQAQIEGVKDTLKSRYPSMSVMASRGYAPYPDAPLAPLSGGQGHWLNPDMLEDGHTMDPRYPEGILVDRWGRGIGVMYIADSPDVPGPDMYVAEDGTSCNGWHYHTEIFADSYWDLYRYGYTDALTTGGQDPSPRSPDLMHVWAYGSYEDQWSHGTPKNMPGQPTPEEQLALIGGPKPPTGAVSPSSRKAINAMRAKYLASALKGVRAERAARKAAARR